MRILNAFLILSHDPHHEHEKATQFPSKPNCSWGQLMVIYDHGKCSFGFGVWYTRALSPAPACCLVTPSPPNNYLKTAHLYTHLSKTAQNYTVTRPWLSSELPWTNQLTSNLGTVLRIAHGRGLRPLPGADLGRPPQSQADLHGRGAGRPRHPLRHRCQGPCC